MNIALHMSRAGKIYSDESAIALGENIIFTYSSLARRVETLAGGLHDIHGLHSGDRIALVAKNCPEYIEILYAAWHAGLIVVPINAKLHAKEIGFILNNCGASICFADPALTASIVAAVDNVLVIGVDSPDYHKLLAADPFTIVNRAPDDPAWIFYTSGTTGKPKGATLSHHNLLTMVHCYICDVDPVSPGDTLLHAAPMSHGSGLIALSYVMKGGLHVVPESRGFDEAEVYALIAVWSKIAFFAAPTMLVRLLEDGTLSDTSNLKLIIYGGGPMYLEHCIAGLDRFGLKLSQLYGQGETPMTITALPANMHDRNHPRWREHLSSVGTAQSGVEVRIADAGGNVLPNGQVGEVLVRSDTVMLGYWNNPTGTKAAIRDGWLWTGDHGVMDEDSFLTLKDRSRDLIISGSSNIYPREIEEVLLRAAGVSEVSVIGRLDMEWGEIVVAYIVRDPSAAIQVVETDLDKLCLEHIARFKRPKVYVFIDSLPKNSYGKVLKKTLRAIDAED